MSENEPTPPLCAPRRLLIAARLVVALVLALAGALALLAARPKLREDQVVLRIGDQRGAIHAPMTAPGMPENTPYEIGRATLPAAAPLLEALSAGAIDLSGVRGAPFAFAYNNGDAKAAVAAGSVDAWSISASYVGIALGEDGDRILADARSPPQAGSAAGFRVASDKALARKRAEIRDFLTRCIRAREWKRTRREELVFNDLVSAKAGR